MHRRFTHIVYALTLLLLTAVSTHAQAEPESTAEPTASAAPTIRVLGEVFPLVRTPLPAQDLALPTPQGWQTPFAGVFSHPAGNHLLIVEAIRAEGIEAALTQFRSDDDTPPSFQATATVAGRDWAIYRLVSEGLPGTIAALQREGFVQLIISVSPPVDETAFRDGLLADVLAGVELGLTVAPVSALELVPFAAELPEQGITLNTLAPAGWQPQNSNAVTGEGVTFVAASSAASSRQSFLNELDTLFDTMALPAGAGRYGERDWQFYRGVFQGGNVLSALYYADGLAYLLSVVLADPQANPDAYRDALLIPALEALQVQRGVPVTPTPAPLSFDLVPLEVAVPRVGRSIRSVRPASWQALSADAYSDGPRTLSFAAFPAPGFVEALQAVTSSLGVQIETEATAEAGGRVWGVLTGGGNGFRTAFALTVADGAAYLVAIALPENTAPQPYVEALLLPVLVNFTLSAETTE